MMRKLSFLVVSFLVLGGLLLFNISCDDDDNGGGSNNECGDSFCIGAIFPETGSASSNAVPMQAAARLAASDINQAGGNIKIIFRDSGGDPEQADTAAQELLDMGVHGIVGAWASTVSLGMIDRVTGNEVVMISPANSSPSLTEYNEAFVMRRGGSPYYYRTNPSDVKQGPIVANTLASDFSQNQIDVVIVYRDDNWGTRLSAEIKTAAMEVTGKTISIEEVSYNHEMLDDANIDATVSGLIMAIEEEVDSNTEAVILLVFDEGDQILREMIRSNIPNPGGDLRYYVGDGYAHPNIDARVSGGDATLVGSTNGITAVQAVANPCRSESFETRLSAFDSEVTEFSFTSNTYDAVVLLALASLSAGSNEPAEYVSEMRKVSREDVSGSGQKCTTYEDCAALLTDGDDTNNDIDYDGFSGAIEFDENGDLTSAFYAVFEYNQMGGRDTTPVDIDGTEVPACPSQ